MKKFTRRMTTFVVSAVLVTGLGAFAANAAVTYTKYKGDVNGDNKLTQADAVLAARKTAGWEGVTIDETAGDMDMSGVFDSADAQKIVQYVSGKLQWATYESRTFTNENVAWSLTAYTPLLKEDGRMYPNSKGGATGKKTYDWEWSGDGGINADSLYSVNVKENNLYRYTVTDSEGNSKTSAIYQLYLGKLNEITSTYQIKNLLASTKYSDGKLTANGVQGAGQYHYEWKKESGTSTQIIKNADITTFEAGAKYTCTVSDEDFYGFYTHKTATSDTWCARDRNDVAKLNDDMHYAVSVGLKSSNKPTGDGHNNLMDVLGISVDEARALISFIRSSNEDYTLKYYLTLDETDTLIAKLDPNYFNIHITDMNTNTPVIRPRIHPDGNANGNSTVTLRAQAVGGSGVYTYQWYYGELRGKLLDNYKNQPDLIDANLENIQEYNCTTSSLTLNVDENDEYYGKYFYCVITDPSINSTVKTRSSRLLKTGNNYELYQLGSTDIAYAPGSDSEATISFYYQATCDVRFSEHSQVRLDDLTYTCKVVNSQNNEFGASYAGINEPTIAYTDNGYGNYIWKVSFKIDKKSFLSEGMKYKCVLYNAETGLTSIIETPFEELVTAK